ncbi:MAG: hypothetical protein Fur0014_11960 [Rubrivivax sp.]
MHRAEPPPTRRPFHHPADAAARPPGPIQPCHLSHEELAMNRPHTRSFPPSRAGAVRTVMRTAMRRGPVVAALCAVLGAAAPAIAQPDLRIGKVEYVGNVKEGSCNTARITVVNDGTTPVTADIPVAHEIDVNEGVARKAATMAGGIGGNTTKAMQIAGVSLWSWAANFTSGVVDWSQSIAESNESNNRLMVPNPPFAGYCARLSVADASGPEGRRMTFAVTLSETSTHPISVDYRVEAAASALNPATAGSACGRGVDFVAASGRLDFAKGEKRKTIGVEVCSDDVKESVETFAVRLLNPVKAELGQATATGAIAD